MNIKTEDGIGTGRWRVTQEKWKLIFGEMEKWWVLSGNSGREKEQDSGMRKVYDGEKVRLVVAFRGNGKERMVRQWWVYGQAWVNTEAYR